MTKRVTVAPGVVMVSSGVQCMHRDMKPPNLLANHVQMYTYVYIDAHICTYIYIYVDT